MWAAGFRNGRLYSVAARPLDPRWSSTDKRRLLGVVATGLWLGWSEDRAFEAGEAYVFLQKHKGISWSKNSRVVEDLEVICSTSRESDSQNPTCDSMNHESDSQNPTGDSMSRVETASSPEELQRTESNAEIDQTE
jgi:hypothetical protein